MKYQIRKVEEVTSWSSSEVATLDPKKFKKLEENPFTGETEQDFLKYIAEFAKTCVYDGIPSDLDDNTADEIRKISEDIKWTEFNNSAMSYENSWFQIGEVDKDYHKTGEFNTHFSSNE
jgi:hypothetical protein